MITYSGDRGDTLSYSEYKISEIRFLPMSRGVFPSYESVVNFLSKNMIQRGGLYFYKTRNLKCESNALILFQYDGKLIASGILIEQGEKELVDETGEMYRGYYKFDTDTVAIFTTPITYDDYKVIDQTFTGFNQSTRKTDIIYLTKIIKLISIRTNKDVKNIHKSFWTEFVKQFYTENSFSIEFNRRKAWEKDYYDLAWNNPSIHICLRHNCRKECLAVEAYIKDKSIFEKLCFHKDEICKEYGELLTFEHTHGSDGMEGKASKIYIEKHFEIKAKDYPQSEIKWLTDNSLKMKYIIEKILTYPINNEVEQAEDLQTVVYSGKEGNQKQYYVTKYERNPENRKAALLIHGYKCQVCGFDFEKAYGELGKGYIEVHHTKPLYSLAEEMIINPETDLVCVCANCHRMLHRKKNEIVGVEELKKNVANTKDNLFEYNQYINIVENKGRILAREYMYKFVPKTLYSYFSNPGDKLGERIGRLVDGEVWFSKKTILNDPFEFQKIIIDKMDSRSKKYYENVVKNIEIFCLTADDKNKLMWSHYASGYKGFCVEFEKIGGREIFPVEYRNDRIDYTQLYMKFLDVIKKIRVGENTTNMDNDLVTKLNGMYCYKDACWKYEKEFRCIASEEDNKDGNLQKLSEWGLKIKRIIAGSKASKELINQLKKVTIKLNEDIFHGYNVNNDKASVIKHMCGYNNIIILEQLYINDELELKTKFVEESLFENEERNNLAKEYLALVKSYKGK